MAQSLHSSAHGSNTHTLGLGLELQCESQMLRYNPCKITRTSLEKKVCTNPTKSPESPFPNYWKTLSFIWMWLLNVDTLSRTPWWPYMYTSIHVIVFAANICSQHPNLSFLCMPPQNQGPPIMPSPWWRSPTVPSTSSTWRARRAVTQERAEQWAGTCL